MATAGGHHWHAAEAKGGCRREAQGRGDDTSQRDGGVMPLLGMGKWFFYWRWRVDSAPPGIGGGQHPSREERRDDALPRDKWDGMLLFESKRGRRLSHGRKEDIAPPRDSRGMACSLLRKEVERGCSLPLLLPPPSFFFSPLFFWEGPTGFTRSHQKITWLSNYNSCCRWLWGQMLVK